MDKEKFWKTVNPLQECVFRFALSILNDKDDARDAVHDILIKLWYKRHKLDDERNIKSFVLKVTRNYCIDLLRKRGGMLMREPSAEELKVNQDYDERDLVEFIKERSCELPLQQRMVLELKDFQDYDYEEISEVLDTPITTLRVNLSRARKFILKLIENEFKRV